MSSGKAQAYQLFLASKLGLLEIMYLFSHASEKGYQIPPLLFQ